MLNPTEFLPSALLCLHKLSLNIISQFKRVENKKKTLFLRKYTSASVTLGNSLFPQLRAGNYYVNVLRVTSRILLRHIETTRPDRSIYGPAGIPVSFCAVRYNRVIIATTDKLFFFYSFLSWGHF